MSRRVVLLIALIALAVFGLAAMPWTLKGSGLSAAMAEHMSDRYGVEAEVEGRSTFALLPIPRVKFENVRLRFPYKTLSAEGGTLRGEIRILPLLLGRGIELAEISLSDARMTGSHRALASQKWAEVFGGLPNSTYARRLVVTHSSLRWTDLESADLDQVNLVFSWAGLGEPLHVAGSVRWRDETVAIQNASLYPDLLASGRLGPMSLTLTAPSGSLAVTGDAQWGEDPRMTGESTIEAKSVRSFTQWSGVQLPFGQLVQALSVSGDFSIDRRRVTWPSVAVQLGSDKLEGTVGVRFDGERPLISGTLAADELDLTNLVLPLAQARTASGAWSEDVIDLVQVTGSSLDLRLSASAAQFGNVRLDDMAANVLVHPGKIEASIGRADFHSGTLKGRLSLAAVNGLVELKSQATFSGVDVAAFLKASGQPRWISGQAKGQFVLEGSGQTPAEMVRQIQGRSSVTVLDGELVGIALDDALRRVEKRPLLASLNWKGGRTSFEEAETQILLKNGIGEITESYLKAPDVLARLEGRISVVDRSLDLKADIAAAGSDDKPAIAFHIGGGWDNVEVTPDARSLIERSGAAKPLFGPDRLPPGEQRPLATAQ